MNMQIHKNHDSCWKNRAVAVLGCMALFFSFSHAARACHSDLFEAEALWSYEELFGVLAYVKADDPNTASVQNLFQEVQARYDEDPRLILRLFDLDKITDDDREIVEIYNKTQAVKLSIITPADTELATFGQGATIKDVQRVFNSPVKKSIAKKLAKVDVLFLYTYMKPYKSECKAIKKILKKAARQGDDLFELEVDYMDFDPNDEDEAYLVNNLGLKPPYKPMVIAMMGSGKVIHTITSPVDLDQVMDVLQLVFSPVEVGVPPSQFGDRILLGE